MSYQFKSHRPRIVDQVIQLLKKGPSDVQQIATRLGITKTQVQGAIRGFRHLFKNTGSRSHEPNCVIWTLKGDDEVREEESKR